MQLFFIPNTESDFYTLSEEESHHCVKVMRLATGDHIAVTDGHGTLCQCTIVEAHPKHCLVQVDERFNDHNRHAFHLHVAVAPTKNTARMEWFVEKAVEMGIDEITPIVCDHSERCVLRQERLQKIAVSAMKQSLKTFMPLIHPPSPLAEVINGSRVQEVEGSRVQEFKRSRVQEVEDSRVQEVEDSRVQEVKGSRVQEVEGSRVQQRFIAYCDGDHRTPLHDIYRPGQDALILIGPEGDFSQQEISLALDAGFQPVTLGQYRLRTETAALAATAYFNLVN